MSGINEDALTWTIGAALVLLWVAGRLGWWKRWYWRSRHAIYPYLPIGVLFLLYPSYSALRSAWSGSPLLLDAGLAVLGVIALWWIIRPPGLIKPAWIRWVEAQPEGAYEKMARAATGGESWGKHVKSKQAVSKWARRLGNRK